MTRPSFTACAAEVAPCTCRPAQPPDVPHPWHCPATNIHTIATALSAAYAEGLEAAAERVEASALANENVSMGEDDGLMEPIRLTHQHLASVIRKLKDQP